MPTITAECVRKLNEYTNCYGWNCKMNSWIRRRDQRRVWVIVLTKGPVVVNATGANLAEAGEQMLSLLSVLEGIALSIES